ncbi:MAG: MATE family efflux transporter, partial [Oscillibacter sp.]|nr:MATE family efflux transporter [Oscillibacter sp.]
TFHCMPGLAIGLAMVTVVSRCVGAGDIGKARFYTKKLMKLTYLFMGICIAITLIVMSPVLRLYNVSQEAENYARQIIWFHGIAGAVFWPMAFALPNALRAAGDTRFTLVASSVSMWTMRVGFGILLGRFWGMGVVGIWVAMFFDWLLRIALFVPRFHGHKWETMGLAKDA